MTLQFGTRAPGHRMTDYAAYSCLCLIACSCPRMPYPAVNIREMGAEIFGTIDNVFCPNALGRYKDRYHSRSSYLPQSWIPLLFNKCVRQWTRFATLYAPTAPLLSSLNSSPHRRRPSFSTLQPIVLTHLDPDLSGSTQCGHTSTFKRRTGRETILDFVGCPNSIRRRVPPCWTRASFGFGGVVGGGGQRMSTVPSL
jgi:hypothetical protein